MKTIRVVLTYLITLCSMVFFFQNTKPIMVQLYFWELEVPLIAVLIAALAAGMVISTLILLPFIFKKKKTEKSKSNSNENRKEPSEGVKENASG